MKKSAVVTISFACLASSSAFAQGKTRNEVYQELIKAQQNDPSVVIEPYIGISIRSIHCRSRV
ncbi:DUF4148 domain-containing protein [Paraburkholderia hospita]|uniref:DUF4148 domain-containing protein n=1 Tax=Paraburkholderia hospita TaxID=169430 RepID=UPI000C1F9FDA|nr:DUF4148 domain-containing protein [Paraburkholderia hospita]